MDVIATHAASKPDAPALIEGERRWTWSGLLERRNRLSSALGALGIRPAEHVIIYAHNSLENLLAGAGIRGAGALAVMMNHRLVAEEVAYILDHSDAAGVFVGDGFLPLVEQVRGDARKVP